jgi:two-component system response regulator AtoC
LSATVLIVDDDEDLRDTLSLLLGLEGHQTIGLADGLAALEWIVANGPPALILLDLRMPRMSGGEFVAALRQAPAHRCIPIVLISGDATCQEAAREMGVETCLVKPIDLDRLLTVVARLVVADQPGEQLRPS